MKKNWIKGAFAAIVAVPALFIFLFFLMVCWDALGSKWFQYNVQQEFIKLNNKELTLYVCHEWKCIFTYLDPKLESYGFLIFGNHEIKSRLSVMQDIYKDFDNNREKCRYIQEGSNICQL